MRLSTDRILTTPVGAVPIPPGLWSKQGVEAARLRHEVADIVRPQREAGVDIVKLDWNCTLAITYVGQESLQQEIDSLRAALGSTPPSAASLTGTAPAGSWHGPHTQDSGMKDGIDLLLSINAQAYLFEAANARHETEFTLWAEVKIPDDKILIPGVAQLKSLADGAALASKVLWSGNVAT